MLNMFSPANDTALAILSLLIETLVYGFVIIWLVVFLLFTILGVFSIDDPVDDEEHDIVYLGHL
jgi:heme/copper-type cytochrome/quinol oxidase subunit 2